MAKQCGPGRPQRTPERDPRSAGGGHLHQLRLSAGPRSQPAESEGAPEGGLQGGSLPGERTSRAGVCESGAFWTRSVPPSSPRHLRAQQAMLSKTMAQSLLSTGLNNRVAELKRGLPLEESACARSPPWCRQQRPNPAQRGRRPGTPRSPSHPSQQEVTDKLTRTQLEIHFPLPNQPTGNPLPDAPKPPSWASGCRSWRAEPFPDLAIADTQ